MVDLKVKVLSVANNFSRKITAAVSDLLLWNLAKEIS